MKSNKVKFSGFLPNGNQTNSINRYIHAYRRLSKPIMKVWPEMAKGTIGYEPGLQIGRLDFTAHQSIQLYEALTGKKYIC